MKIKNRRWHKKRYLEKRFNFSSCAIAISPFISKFDMIAKFRNFDDNLDFFTIGLFHHKPKISLSPTI